MKGFIALEEAAERWSGLTRQTAFRSLNKHDVRKLLRDLRDRIREGPLEAFVMMGASRYVPLTAADMLSRPFGLNLNLNGQVGAETVHNRGELRPMLIRKCDFDKLHPAVTQTATVVWVTFEALQDRGVNLKDQRSLLRREKRGEFPPRVPGRGNSKPVWVKTDIDLWFAGTWRLQQAESESAASP